LIKNHNLCSETVGIELFEQASAKAPKVVDRVYHLDIENEKIPSDLGQFELILILDVLEHLLDPWSVLARIKDSHLRPDGKMIISLPNARHFSLLLPLMLSGEFEYKERGILDKTHLRFFTRFSGERMLHEAGLEIQRVKRTSLQLSSNSGKLNALSLGLFSEFLTSQYIYLVKNRENG